MIDAYADAGVDTAQSDRGVRALVDVLRTIDTGRPSRSVLAGGHYAAVLEIAPGLGLALCTDGVGSKLILAEQLGRLDTVGVDCVAMNVNDIICVGAEPVALVDYIAVEAVDTAALAQIAAGLKRGAELAGVEIPGGELAVLPEMIRGHPSPHGFELSATAVGTVALQGLVTGAACAAGDALIGLPSSGLHSNGYTLARRLSEGRLDERPPALAGASVGEALLEPTAIYVRAVGALLEGGAPVRGLAHITGDGVLNLRRLNAGVGFEIDAPLAVPAICSWLCEAGSIAAAHAYQVFNMGCGFIVVVPEAEAAAAAELLAGFHPGARVIGHVSAAAGAVTLPPLGVSYWQPPSRPGGERRSRSPFAGTAALPPPRTSTREAHNTPMSTTPETLVGGRYRLERQIGSGATARVWLAFDQVLERRVAVKMLATPIGGETAHIERFRREARAVANLQHAHIVTVLDSGEHDGIPFIVLEYIDGETLKERIQRVGRLTISEAVAIAIEVARALDAAHAHGLVHRDVKPQNILLDAEGGAKITDFGIARSGGEDGLTVGGRVLGTTEYVSPEQALGHQVSGQSDLYSLGVVLYESLTGSVPFSAPSQIAVATMHVRVEIPDVQARRPDVSAALAAVVERATAKHLARRYASARELIADLEEALAIETARTGDAGREATLVIRSMPEQTTRRVPVAVRHPAALAVAAIGSLAAVAAIVTFIVESTHRGVGAPVSLARAPHETVVRLGQTAAISYNPFGTTPEDPGTVEQAIDGNIATTWQTSTYVDGELGKSGVGLYVNAAPDAAANEAVVVTPTPGFHFQIWGTDVVPSITYTPVARPGFTPASLGWTLLGSGLAAKTTTVRLRHVRERLFYLLWITDLGPDPTHTGKSVQIAEFELRQRS